MALPVPNLDDRRFQELVNDSKRLVQQKCPEWRDHNVHDPGVTLIEVFAWMADQVIYRLNRVPDKAYVKFLELLGVQLFPPTAARAPVTFWLTAPPQETLRVPVGTQVATVRTETKDAIVFETSEDLDLVPCAFGTAASAGENQRPRQRDQELERGEGFHCFSPVPQPGDALLIGLTEAVPRCAVTLRLGCKIEGVGVDPTWPPLAWEAWDGQDWLPCEVEQDQTGGLNQDGDVVLHVPRSHSAVVLELQRAGWLRARVTPAQTDQPAYSASPLITRISAFTIGGTIEADNAEVVREEVLDRAEGVANQRFQLQRHPVVPGEDRVLEVSEGEGWKEWEEVRNFSNSSAEDLHFVLNPTTGEIALGPEVRQPDGARRQYGRIPEKGATVRLRSYRTGGGSGGNVARGTLTVLKSSIPYVAWVENRRAATGGVDGESIEEAKIRGPIEVHTRSRAVTREDYEYLARLAAPDAARLHCVAAGDGVEAGTIRLLVVPNAPSSGGRLRFEDLEPPSKMVQEIARRLDECRLIGSRVLVEPPHYQGLTVVARLRPRLGVSPGRLQAQALEALYSYFHPILGGPQSRGWPFGRPVHVGEVYSVLQGLNGTELVEDVRLFGADPVTGARGEQSQRLEVAAHELIFSYGHQVRVDER